MPSRRRPAKRDVLVRIRGLRFYRGDRAIFDGVDIDILRGKVTAIMGPSGTGKTTLLKLIGGQLRPSAGSIEVDGQNIHALGTRDLYELRKRMGMLFQSGALLTDLSVFENVAYPLPEHTDLPESMIRKQVLLKLEAVGLRGARDLMPAELSGGMARRVALARGIALDPMTILYDEPFTGQDPISMGVLVQLIRRLNGEGGGALARAGGELADAGDTGREGRGPDAYEGWAGLDEGLVGLFAPGPADPRWPDILARRPDLAPAVESRVRGVADGAPHRAHRVDRLRACGNGVVPLQAAVALRELLRRATD